jgi:hypothetical protein
MDKAIVDTGWWQVGAKDFFRPCVRPRPLPVDNETFGVNNGTFGVNNGTFGVNNETLGVNNETLGVNNNH